MQSLKRIIEFSHWLLQVFKALTCTLEFGSKDNTFYLLNICLPNANFETFFWAGPTLTRGY